MRRLVGELDVVDGDEEDVVVDNNDEDDDEDEEDIDDDDSGDGVVTKYGPELELADVLGFVVFVFIWFEATNEYWFWFGIIR